MTAQDVVELSAWAVERGFVVVADQPWGRVATFPQRNTYEVRVTHHTSYPAECFVARWAAERFILSWMGRASDTELADAIQWGWRYQFRPEPESPEETYEFAVERPGPRA